MECGTGTASCGHRCPQCSVRGARCRGPVVAEEARGRQHDHELAKRDVPLMGYAPPSPLTFARIASVMTRSLSISPPQCWVMSALKKSVEWREPPSASSEAHWGGSVEWREPPSASSETHWGGDQHHPLVVSRVGVPRQVLGVKPALKLTVQQEERIADRLVRRTTSLLLEMHVLATPLVSCKGTRKIHLLKAAAAAGFP